VNYLLRNIEERQPSKKKTNPSRRSISKFLFGKDTLRKKDVSQKESLENLGLLIVKNN
jgi:hypothetical protein